VSVYYRPVKSAPKVQACFAEPIKALIEESPSFGYRTVAHLLGFNKNTVRRIFQLKGWQVCKRPIGFRPRVQAMPSVATLRTSDGRQMCAASGPVATIGLRWRWRLTAKRANYVVGRSGGGVGLASINKPMA